MKYDEEIYDLEPSKLALINKKINDDVELKQAYCNSLLTKVNYYQHQPGWQTALQDCFKVNMEQSDWSSMIELAKFLEKMILLKNQELTLLLLKDYWKTTFGALDYLPPNYDIGTGQFKRKYLQFLEEEVKPLLPRATIPAEFVRLVNLRFRAIYLFEYVMVAHFSEESMVFIATVILNESDHEFHQFATPRPHFKRRFS